MTIDEAIIHAENVASKCTTNCFCAEEHRQLAEWLRKYQKIQEIVSDFREYQKGILCGFGGVTYMQMVSEVIEDGNDDR